MIQRQGTKLFNGKGEFVKRIRKFVAFQEGSLVPTKKLVELNAQGLYVARQFNKHRTHLLSGVVYVSQNKAV